jgi:(1->4)-alpha-D-glucan 1-alpha-D-glucosylmutase
VQLGSEMRFDDVRALVGYLAELGIGSIYLSPIFRAQQDSTHGYDSIDPRQLEPRLGSEQDFAELAAAARRQRLGIVADVVPNHMGISDAHNVWWQDVLVHGQASNYAQYFDIDWHPPKAALRGKVLLAVLGEQFGRVLENQQLSVTYQDQAFVVAYADRHFPTDPKSWVPLLKAMLEIMPEPTAPAQAVPEPAGVESPERMELQSIISALDHIPPRDQGGAEAIEQRYRESEVTRRRLSALLDASPVLRDAMDRVLTDYNGRRGEPASFDRLEAFLADQAYRLCYWRVATDEINYRRFFDVDALAAIRVEDPDVFDAVHETLLRFVGQGWVTSLRIDHADGLADPRQYLCSLAQAVGHALSQGPADKCDSGIYTVVEKILAPDETLPGDWPVAGTTGYDFLNLLNGIYVDRLGAYALRDIFARFTHNPDSFAQVLYESKRTILATSLSAELYTLSHQLERISEQHRWSRDFTHLSLHRALREIMACFPVYRTYVRPGSDGVGDEDRKRIQMAVRHAKRRNPAMSPTFFDFIASVLLLEHPEGLPDEGRQERQRFAIKFQQVTGPVTAKGTEDTAFYRYYPLLSLNEVGGDPTMAGISIENFHRRIQDQASTWPDTMLTTGTHDTKRGEDVRARLNVLSEAPQEWEAAIQRWQTMNAEARRELDGAPVPDAAEEYLIYQTLVGTWPLHPLAEGEAAQYVERIIRYMEKALREAKLHTSWLNPNEEYDAAVSGFVRAILGDLRSPLALDVEGFARSIADAGFVNSLSQALGKIASPGVSDFYQGTEFWDFALVDPDNRGKVDFARRREALDEIKLRAERDLNGLVAELLKHWPDERLKLLLIWRALQFRGESTLLISGAYHPLSADGDRKGELCAFARTDDGHWALCIVPRLSSRSWLQQSTLGNTSATWPLASWWSGTVLSLPPDAPRRYRHFISGRRIETTEDPTNGQRILDVAQVFESFPVALLAGQDN